MSTPRIVVAILRRFLPLFAAFCVLQPLGAGEKNAPPPRPLRQWTLNRETGRLESRDEEKAKWECRAASAVELQGRAGMTLGANGRCALAEPVGDGWNAITLAAEVYLENPRQGYQGIVCRDCKGGPAGDVFALLLTPDGKWTARVKTTRGQKTAAAPARTGWHWLAMTYDGRQLRLFADGAPVAATAQSGPLVSEPQTPIAFGTFSKSPFGRLRGAVRQVSVWQQALAPEQLAVLAAIQGRDAARAQAAEGFRFAEASDIHMTDTRSVEIVNQAVDRINADPDIAFSLWLGDLTQDSTHDEMILARLALSRLKKPAYVLRGNHDRSGGWFEKEFGSLRQRFEYGGWVFLLADSNPGDKTPMSQTDRDWLRKQLETIDPKTPIVLCTHHPLMPHTRAYHLAGADEVVALFAGHNLKACLSGHYHGNQEEIVNGILFTTTACLATTRNNFDGTTARGYRIFECRNGDITTRFVPVRDIPRQK